MRINKQNKGFTLLEILLVIAAIGILAAIVLVAINPNRQIAQARNLVRQADINTIQKALEQYLIDNGRYPTSVSTTPGYICNTGTEQTGVTTTINCNERVDLRELVPDYIASIPKDPQATGNDTGYIVVINDANNKISISADLAEGKIIAINLQKTTFGLAGKFFNGNWRATIANGNIGDLPLTQENNSSNVIGTLGLPSENHRYGVNLWNSISFGNDIGSNYGFIAIGYFVPPTTGIYTIYTASDDGSGVWIGDLALTESIRTANNATLNNNLGGGQGVTKRSATISLIGGYIYPIRIVMEEGGGGDALTFSWSGPGISETTDLSQYFITPINSTGQLFGNYFFRPGN
jgi:prepilin-type N-terminal cleavage/methylation domain-containing protein